MMCLLSFERSVGELVSPPASQKKYTEFATSSATLQNTFRAYVKKNWYHYRGCLETFTIMDKNWQVSLLKTRNDWHYFLAGTLPQRTVPFPQSPK